MSITLVPMDLQGSDKDVLIEFFTSNDFPFHVRSDAWTRGQVEQLIDDSGFNDGAAAAYWLDDDAIGRVGYLRLEDLHDDTPMFDLRLGQ